MRLLTSSDVGAPVLDVVNGELCAVLDWALVQEGWAIEYSSANARVYRPGTGHRRRLHVNHNSAVSGGVNKAVWRGCEDASGATTLVNPFPTVALVPNANSIVLLANDTTPGTVLPYRIVVGETFVHLLILHAGAIWTWCFFGDCPGNNGPDDWNTLCMNRGANSASPSGAGPLASPFYSSQTYDVCYHWCRDITGIIKSSRAAAIGFGDGWSSVSNAPPPMGGYQGKIRLARPTVGCFGSATTTPGATGLLHRGQIPHAWSMLHTGFGGLADQDVFQSTDYNPLAEFRAYQGGSARTLIMEETDTWEPM